MNNVTLIMKGGGIKGLAYVGAIEELKKFYSFNWYAGTSAGAIAAILLSSGYTSEELKKILSEKNFNDFKDANYIRRIWNLISKKGLFEANTFTDWLDNLLSKKLNSPVDILLKDLPHRVTVYASRRGKNALIFDSHDKKKEDTRAAFSARCSMSIPFVFTPQVSEGIRVFDGGAQNNYPVEILLKENPNTEFIGLYLGPKIFEGNSKSKSIIKELISIWTESSDIEALRKYKDKTIIIDPRPISTLNFKLNEKEKKFLLLSGNYEAKNFLVKQSIVPKNYYKSEDLHRQLSEIDKIRADLIKTNRKNKIIKRIIYFILIFSISIFTFIHFSKRSDKDLTLSTEEIYSVIKYNHNEIGLGRNPNKEDINDYIKSIAQEADSLSKIWGKAVDELSTSIINDDFEKLEKLRLEFAYFGVANIEPFYRLKNFYSIINNKKEDFEYAPTFVDKIANSIGTIINFRKESLEKLDDFVNNLNSENLFLNKENKLVKIQSLKESVDILKREAASIRVLSESLNNLIMDNYDFSNKKILSFEYKYLDQDINEYKNYIAEVNKEIKDLKIKIDDISDQDRESELFRDLNFKELLLKSFESSIKDLEKRKNEIDEILNK